VEHSKKIRIWFWSKSTEIELIDKNVKPNDRKISTLNSPSRGSQHLG
jgi:hypothetical protein